MVRGLTRLKYYDPPSPVEAEEPLSTGTSIACTSTNVSADASPASGLELRARRSVSFALPDESSGEIPVSSSSPGDSLGAVDEDFKVSSRQERKCRNRGDNVSWFEAKAFKILPSPQLPSEHAAELRNGDLYMNWIDREMMVCQVWMSTGGRSGGWKSMQWGSKKANHPQRLVITAKGFPSFVAESTWKKKYKLSNPRIKVYSA